MMPKNGNSMWNGKSFTNRYCIDTAWLAQIFMVMKWSGLFTCCWKAQLSASHLRIRRRPRIITHSAPDVIPAHLNTSSSCYWTTSQSYVPIVTDFYGKYTQTNNTATTLNVSTVRPMIDGMWQKQMKSKNLWIEHRVIRSSCHCSNHWAMTSSFLLSFIYILRCVYFTTEARC